MRQLTGRHVLMICLAFFGVIIAVNVLLAVKAVSTFPGLEVENSYVASQTFDADRAAQQALGWELAKSYDAERGELRLTFTDARGFAAPVRALKVLVGRPTDATDDRYPDFTELGGSFVAPLRLAPGKWMLHVEARAADGTSFRQRLDLLVGG
ncbi:MAG: FixH family protein [Anaerolineae bacterium]|nr:FixH family protein [Anaerolineae bacterium]